MSGQIFGLSKKQTDCPYLQISAIFGKHLHPPLATYVSCWPEPSSVQPTFVFSCTRSRPPAAPLTNGEKWIANAQHPTPPAATYWTHFADKFKSNMFKPDWTRGSARPGLIQLFLKFCRYWCGGDRYRQRRDILRPKQTEILSSAWALPSPILLNIYPSDHTHAESFYVIDWPKNIFRRVCFDCTIVVLCKMRMNMPCIVIFIGICLVQDCSTHPATWR